MNKQELSLVYSEMNYSFRSQIERDDGIQSILRKVEKGKATFRDMNKFSVDVGTDLSRALTAAITPERFPTISQAEAEATVLPMLEEAYNTISAPTAAITKALNEAAGVGLNAVEPPFNTDRAVGICQKLASYDKLEDGLWVLKEPVINFSQNVVDASISANAEATFQAGMSPKIIRSPDSGACKWCRNLAGEYDYPEKVPKDVFRRHEDCRCIVEYFPSGRKGKRQDVWDKKWRTQQESEARSRIQRVEREAPKLTKKDPKEVEKQAEALRTGKPAETAPKEPREYDDLDRLTIERLEKKYLEHGKSPEEARRLAEQTPLNDEQAFLKLKEAVRKTEEARESLIQTVLDGGVAKNRTEAEKLADAALR